MPMGIGASPLLKDSQSKHTVVGCHSSNHRCQIVMITPQCAQASITSSQEVSKNMEHVSPSLSPRYAHIHGAIPLQNTHAMNGSILPVHILWSVMFTASRKDRKMRSKHACMPCHSLRTSPLPIHCAMNLPAMVHLGRLGARPATWPALLCCVNANQ